MKEVSIIIPVYNSGATIGECLDNLLRQKLSDYEILVIDDGSTDDSLSIAKLWAQKASQIKVFSQENDGPSSARNLGIQNANGRYFVFIDSDDRISENYISNMLEVQKKYGEKALPVSMIRAYKNDSEIRSVICSGRINILEGKEVLKLYRDLLLNSPVNKLFNGEIIRKKRLLFRRDIRLGEDLLFNIDYLNSYEIAEFIILQDNEYYYRCDDAGSLSHKFHDNYFESQNEQYHKLWDLARRKGAPEEDYSIFWQRYEHFLAYSLRYNMRKDSPYSFREKIRINSNIMKTEDFRSFVERNKGGFAPFMERAYRSGDYFKVWIVQGMLEKYQRFREKSSCRS